MLQVNGKEITYEGEMSLAALLLHLEFANQICAVEVNTALVSHRERKDFQLHEGDIVEIVTLVGGG